MTEDRFGGVVDADREESRAPGVEPYEPDRPSRSLAGRRMNVIRLWRALTALNLRPGRSRWRGRDATPQMFLEQR